MSSETPKSEFEEELLDCATIIERYIVSLVNVAYYVCYHKLNEEAAEPVSSDKQTVFRTVRDKLLFLAVRTEKITSSKSSGAADIKSLLSREFLRELYYCSNAVSTELYEIMERITSGSDGEYEAPMKLTKVPTHLKNCILGFVQIFHFFRKLPIQEQYQISKLQMRVLELELKTDLLGPWTRQVETLHLSLIHI